MLKNNTNNGSIFALAVLTVCLIILSPLIGFAIGAFIGWLIKITFASLFLRGLSLFNLELTANQIPLFCGVLGVIGSFFKSTTTRSAKSN